LSGPFTPGDEGVNLIKGVTLINRFQIKCLLGKGRFGATYLAQDALRSAEVALKVVDLGHSGENLAVLHFQHEMTVNDRILDYSHVIQVFDFHLVLWEETMLLLQSMEYANKGTFRKWLAEHKEDFETRRKLGLKFFKQACYGVCSFHNYITHLDLKPENLLFCDDVLKVSDFGTAKLAEPIENSAKLLPEISSLKTGTPVYMSPEQFLVSHPDDLDARSDLYSLGVILYEMLHPKGHPPFNGSYNQLRELHLKAPVPLLPEFGEKYSRIITRCLEKDPANRYQAIDDLVDAFEEKRIHKHSLQDSNKVEDKKPSDLLEKIWEKASHCYTHGSFKEAAALSNEVLNIQPDHTQARRLNEELSDRFARAEQFYQEISLNLEGDLSILIKLLEEAIAIYPNHPSGHLIQTKIAARARQFRKAMEKGLIALQEENWETALNWYHKAFQLNPATQHLSQLIESLNQVVDTRRKMEAALQERKFDTALYLAHLVDIHVDEMKDQMPALRESRIHNGS
jgi:serine/threonine protein kinase